MSKTDWAAKFAELGLNPPGSGDLERAYHETVVNLHQEQHPAAAKAGGDQIHESKQWLADQTKEA